MKTASFIRSLGVGVLCMLATYTSLWAQYPTTSYKLSTDGSTLEKWLGDETEINLTEAPLNAVQQIGEKAFSSNRDLQKNNLGPLCEENRSIGFRRLYDALIDQNPFVSKSDRRGCLSRMQEIGSNRPRVS